MFTQTCSTFREKASRSPSGAGARPVFSTGGFVNSKVDIKPVTWVMLLYIERSQTFKSDGPQMTHIQEQDTIEKKLVRFEVYYCRVRADETI